jgi:PAC2 family
VKKKMAQYFAVNKNDEWPEHVSRVLMPSIGMGNVSQMAIDVLVETSNTQIGGRLESNAVLALSALRKDAVHTNLDFYFPCNRKQTQAASSSSLSSSFSLALLQQRAPVALDCNRLFAAQLLDFLSAKRVQQLVLVHCVDAALRSQGSSEHGGRLVHFLLSSSRTGGDDAHDALMSSSCTELPCELIDDVAPEHSFVGEMRALCSRDDSSVSLLVLVYFSSSNAVPESVVVAASLNRLAGPIVGGDQWRVPAFWSTAKTIDRAPPSLF